MVIQKPSTPQVIAHDCIAVRVRILNRVVSKIYDEELRPLGLKISQGNILVAIGQRGIARPGEICSGLKMDLSTVSRNVERMAARGWIQVLPDEEDSRAQKLRLSRKGISLLEKMRPLWEAAQNKTAALLGESGVANLFEAIERVRAAPA